MSKAEVFEFLRDLNYAYNDCMMLDSLKHFMRDVVDVKHGHWEILSSYLAVGIVKCSVCGEAQVSFHIQQLDNYCPNCGAYMRGESEED